MMAEWVGRNSVRSEKRTVRMMAEGAMRRRLLLAAAGWMAIAVPAFGQGTTASTKLPAYEVAAIKPNKSDGGMTRLSITADRYSATNNSLKMMIEYAYDLKADGLVSGLPGWADSARFDIEAKMDEDTVAALKKLSNEERTEQRRLMTQSLLADRFQLKVHHESKEMPMYALVIAKGGLKLKDADLNGTKGPDGVPHGGGWSSSDGQLTAHGIPISGLANFLSRNLHREVVDKTGLTGKYDFKLKW